MKSQRLKKESDILLYVIIYIVILYIFLNVRQRRDGELPVLLSLSAFFILSQFHGGRKTI